MEFLCLFLFTFMLLSFHLGSVRIRSFNLLVRTTQMFLVECVLYALDHWGWTPVWKLEEPLFLVPFLNPNLWFRRGYLFGPSSISFQVNYPHIGVTTHYMLGLVTHTFYSVNYPHIGVTTQYMLGLVTHIFYTSWLILILKSVCSQT